MNLEKVLEKEQGIMLDIGCGGNKQQGFVGMDIRELPGVDIVWDIRKFPFPLPDESVTTAICSHLVEHIPPFAPDPGLIGLVNLLRTKHIINDKEIEHFIGDLKKPKFIGFMDEVWRILKPEAKLLISCPYARSSGFMQDPTHCNQINEATWCYFDPDENKSGGLLWSIYKPKPWKIDWLSWSPEANMEVVMVKRGEQDEG